MHCRRRRGGAGAVAIGNGHEAGDGADDESMVAREAKDVRPIV